MKTSTTRLLALLSALFVSSVALPAFATSGNVSGTVTALKSQDTTFGNSFFLVSSTTHVGQCQFDGASGQTLALIPDNDRGKQMFAIAQAALLAGKNVTFFVDDGGSPSPVYCFAKFVVISP